jgi:hypothetical protein
MVGFTGSRNLAQSYFPLVSRVVAGFAGQPLAVGCAAGADQAVRLAAPGVQVFQASAFGAGRHAFVKRSVALVQAVAGSSSPLIVGFVGGSCPAGLVPSPQVSRCFNGSGSGTWATLALATGLGVPVAVFWCGSGVSQLPAAWGQWGSASGHLAGGWHLAPVQSALF